jgi:uncharacterized protein YbjQ (UPF0145 family)
MQHTTIVKLSPQAQVTGVIAASNEEHSNAHGKHKHRHGLGLKKLWKGIKKYNPALALVRNGALLGFDLNVMGNSMRLYPALITPEQAKKDGIKIEAIEKAKPAWEKVKKLWGDRFSGNIESLEKAIRRGAKHKVTKMKKKHGADGVVEYYFDDNDYSNVVGTAAVAAGSVALIAVAAIISKSGAMKKPFEDDAQNDDDSGGGNETEGAGDGNDQEDSNSDSENSGDDSSGADGVIFLTTKKVAITGIALGGLLGLAYALRRKENFKDTAGYVVAGGLIGYGLEYVIKNNKTN